ERTGARGVIVPEGEVPDHLRWPPIDLTNLTTEIWADVASMVGARTQPSPLPSGFDQPAPIGQQPDGFGRFLRFYPNCEKNVEVPGVGSTHVGSNALRVLIELDKVYPREMTPKELVQVTGLRYASKELDNLYHKNPVLKHILGRPATRRGRPPAGQAPGWRL